MTSREGRIFFLRFIWKNDKYLPSMVNSPDGFNSHSCARLKLGGRNSNWVPTWVTGIWTVICSCSGTLAGNWIRSEVAKSCISTLMWAAGIPSGGTIYYATPIRHSVNSNIMYRFMLPSALGSEQHSSSNLSPPVTNQPLPPDIWQLLTYSVTTDLSFWECHKKWNHSF